MLSVQYISQLKCVREELEHTGPQWKKTGAEGSSKTSSPVPLCPSKGSWTGLVMVRQLPENPAVTKKIHRDEACLRLGQEVKSIGQGHNQYWTDTWPSTCMLRTFVLPELNVRAWAWMQLPSKAETPRRGISAQRSLLSSLLSAYTAVPRQSLFFSYSLKQKHSYIFIRNGRGNRWLFPNAILFYADMHFEAYGFRFAQHFSYEAHLGFNESHRFEFESQWSVKSFYCSVMCSMTATLSILPSLTWNVHKDFVGFLLLEWIDK